MAFDIPPTLLALKIAFLAAGSASESAPTRRAIAQSREDRAARRLNQSASLLRLAIEARIERTTDFTPGCEIALHERIRRVLQRGRRFPRARAPPPQLDACRSCPCDQADYRRRARRRRGVFAAATLRHGMGGWQGHSLPLRRRITFAAAFHAVGRRRAGGTRRPRRRGAHLLARRRQEFAGSPEHARATRVRLQRLARQAFRS